MLRRHRLADRLRPRRTAGRRRSSSFPASRMANGGSRMPPRACRRSCSATSPAGASPIFARRPAARRRSSFSPAPTSPRSIRREPAAAPRNLRPPPAYGRTVEANLLKYQPDATVRRDPARRALLFDRHGAPPPRHPLDEERPRTSPSWRTCRHDSSPRHGHGEAGRTHGLLQLFARPRRGRAAGRRFPRGSSRDRARRRAPRRDRRRGSVVTADGTSAPPCRPRSRPSR